MTSDTSSTTNMTQTGETDAEGETQITDEMLPDTASLVVPASANRGEAAAIAAAVGAHLHDRAAAETADDTYEKCNRWKLCGRLRGRTPPREVARGEEWKAAARSRW